MRDIRNLNITDPTAHHHTCARLRPTILKMALQGALAGSVMIGTVTLPQHAQAQNAGAATPAPSAFPKGDTVIHFAIPAGPLDAALKDFARLASVNISYDAALVSGRRTQGASGRLSIVNGLLKLIEGSGLEPLAQPGGGYSLRQSAQAAPAASVSTLPAVIVTATPDSNVTTEGTGSYAARGITLFKGVQSLKDIPQSVTVITRQQMDDQGLDTLDEVLANTTGITLVKRPEGGNDFYSRGFMTNNVQYDGIPLQRSSTWGNSFASTSIYLDRVEVLRGAQGLLEGSGNPAGAINVIRKRGLSDKTFKVEGRAGSWDNYGTRLEAGGAMDQGNRIRSRVVLDAEHKNSFLDTISDRHLNAYAALDVHLTPDTAVGLGLVQSNLNGNSALAFGQPRYATGQALNVPRSTNVGADWNNVERRETQIFLDLEHRFSADWKLKVASAYIKENWDSIESTSNGTVHADGRSVNGVGYAYDFNADHVGLDANLSGRFKALGIHHDLTLGGNYSKQKRDDKLTQYWNYMVYDVFDIDHDAPRLGTTEPTYSGGQKSRTLQKGLYGMMRSHLTENMTVVWGGRVSWYEYETSARWQLPAAISTTFSEMRETGEFTPYAGAVYALTPQWSLYGSYADIFQPQTATDAQRHVLKPIVGKNYEVGIKGELLDGTLNTSLAVFRIDQQNRAVRDEDAPMVCGSSGSGYCSRAAGKVRSQGIELEARGQLARGWQISAGYTYSRNETLNDYIQTNIGKPFDYVSPRHMLRLWSDWQLPGDLSKWRLGAGVNFRSEQKTSSTTKINPVQGGYSVWNARVAYQIDKTWTVALNIENVFDKHYYAYISNTYDLNHIGVPRNVVLTVRGSF